MAHKHNCLSCSTVIEEGNFDCEGDTDHDYACCDSCAAPAKPQPAHQWREVSNSYLGHGESEYQFVCNVCHARGWQIVDNETDECTSRFHGDDEPCAKTSRDVLIARLHNSR